MTAPPLDSKPIIFSGGPILTMAEPLRVEAITILGDRILRAGSLEDCRAAAGRDREERDLSGRTLMPGFVDAHTHPLILGQTQTWLDVSPRVAPSIPALIAALHDQAHQLSPGVPLRAFGFDPRVTEELREPLAAELDVAATDREVYIMNVSGHGGSINSFGLATHGITADTPDPRGGRIGRHPDGRPNGLVMDAACDLLTGEAGVKIGNHGPNIHLPETPDVAAHQLALAMQSFLRAGITTVVDAQVTRRELETYLAAKEAERLPIRVNMLVISALLDELLTLGLVGRRGDDELGRMRLSSIVPVSQPQHHRAFGDGVARTVGPDLAQGLNPLGLYVRAGIPLALSSDAPVALPRPLESVQAAVDRRTVNGTVLGGPELCVDVLTALRGYTIGAAYAAHREERVGSLEAGKLADFAVLAADPMSVPVEQLDAIDVVETWIGGRQIAISDS